MKRTYSTTVISAPKKSEAPRKKRSKKNAYATQRLGFSNRNGVKPQLKSTLKYAEHIKITPAANGCYSYPFRINSLYDPDVAVGGHQPMGFDEIMALYGHAYVVSARIRVTQLMEDTTTSIPGAFGVTFTDGSTSAFAGKALSTVLEDQHTCEWKAAGGTVTSAMPRVIASIDCNKWFNVKDLVGQEDKRISAAVDASNQIYAHVWFGSDLATAGAQEFVVEIEYDAVFSDPKALTAS